MMRAGRVACGLAVFFLLSCVSPEAPVAPRGGTAVTGPRVSHAQGVSVAGQLIALKKWQSTFNEQMPAIIEGLNEIATCDRDCDYRKVERARDAIAVVFRTQKQVSGGLKELIYALETGRVTGIRKSSLEGVERHLKHNIDFLERHRDKSKFFGKVLVDNRKMLARLPSLQMPGGRGIIDTQTACKFFELAALFVEFSYAQLGLVDELLKEASQGRVVEESVLYGGLDDLSNRFLKNNYEFFDRINELFAELKKHSEQARERVVVEGRPYNRIIRATASCSFNGIQSREDAELCAVITAKALLVDRYCSALITVSKNGLARSETQAFIRKSRVVEIRVSERRHEVTATVEAFERDLVPLF